MTTTIINADIRAIADRLNELNGHDCYRFFARGNRLILRDIETNDEIEIRNPIASLAAMESADYETRNYGMPGLVF